MASYILRLILFLGIEECQNGCGVAVRLGQNVGHSCYLQNEQNNTFEIKNTKPQLDLHAPLTDDDGNPQLPHVKQTHLSTRSIQWKPCSILTMILTIRGRAVIPISGITLFDNEEYFIKLHKE